MGEQIMLFVDGQKMPLADVRERFAYLAVLTKTGKDILRVLLKSQRPLTRKEIAQEVDRHIIRVHEILTELIATDLICRFRTHSRTYYYVLTEQGYNIAKAEDET